MWVTLCCANEAVGADPAPFDAVARGYRNKGAGVILVAIDNVLEGLLAIADPVRTSAHDAIAALRSEGLRIIMLTGDNRASADAVALEVGGLDDVRADLLPEDKSRIFAKLKAAGAKVAMAGDDVEHPPKPFFSFLFNGIGVPIAAGVLYPVSGVFLSPMLAGAAMALSSFTVVANALRLSTAKL